MHLEEGIYKRSTKPTYFQVRTLTRLRVPDTKPESQS